MPDTYVLTLEMDVDAEGVMFLNKYSRVMNQIYNGLLDTAVHRLNKLKRDPEYQSLVKDKNASGRSKRLRALRTEYGFTEYVLHEKAAEMKHYFHDICGIDEAQKQATKAFRAVEKMEFHQSCRIRHHALNGECSFEGKSSRSTLRWKNGIIYFGRNRCFSAIIKKKDDYAREALASGTVKYVRVLKRTIRGKDRFYAQLVMKGIPPRKHKCGSSRTVIGLDVGVSTCAESSNKHVELHELAPDITRIDNEIRHINRAMERSRRANNPKNYNDDGTCKGGRHRWKLSKRYCRLRQKRKDLYRKRHIAMKESHERLANEILSRGTTVICERMNYRALQKRAKKTTVNARNGRYNRKSRFGKSLANHAPAMFEGILNRKLLYVGRELIRTDTAKVRASQLNHVTGEYTKKDLSVRMFDIGGHQVQRDLYAAFLTGHTYYSSEDSERPDAVNFEACSHDFKKFLRLHKKAVQQLKDNNALSWYIR